MLLPWAIASSAWALAQIGDANEALSRVQQAEQLLGKSDGKWNSRSPRLGLRCSGSRLPAA
jgi:hypothetical protein